MTQNRLDYNALMALLMRHKLSITAAELQGMAMGLYAAGLPLDAKDWKQQLFAFISNEPAQLAALDEQLTELQKQLVAALAGEQDAFELLLPTDDEFIIERAEALTYWCQGFNLGFQSLSSPRAIVEENAKEAFEDLDAISHLDLDSISEELDDEKDLFSLIEHVKVSSLLIFYTQAAQVKPTETLH